MQEVDYLLIGPAYPYRGGIADSQNEFARSLTDLGKKVKLFTFKKLYPNFLFPGKSQFTKNIKPLFFQIFLMVFFSYPKVLITLN